MPQTDVVYALPAAYRGYTHAKVHRIIEEILGGSISVEIHLGALDGEGRFATEQGEPGWRRFRTLEGAELEAFRMQEDAVFAAAGVGAGNYRKSALKAWLDQHGWHRSDYPVS